MRRYGQYCGLAKALDLVGDRWTLLIVRELLTRGQCRYTDLQDGLPGIATNLLATRLAKLEESGIVRRQSAPPPVPATLYALTERGVALEEAVSALGRWGSPLLGALGRDDEFRSHWLALPARLYLTDRTPHRPPVKIELHVGDEPVTLETANGGVRARPGPCENPDAVLTGAPHTVMGLLMGRLDLQRARAAGLRFEGDRSALRRVRPRDRGPRGALRREGGAAS